MSKVRASVSSALECVVTLAMRRPMIILSCRRRKRFSALMEQCHRIVSRSHSGVSSSNARTSAAPLGTPESCHMADRSSPGLATDCRVEELPTGTSWPNRSTCEVS